MSDKSFIRWIWLSSSEDRKWLNNQMTTHYNGLKKSRVLYALKRLTKMFDISLHSLDATTKLIDAYDNGRRFKRPSRIFVSLGMSKLEYIGWDYDDANDDMMNWGLPPYSVNMDVTVADYVRFIDDYDAKLKEHNGFGVVNVYGRY